MTPSGIPTPPGRARRAPERSRPGTVVGVVVERIVTDAPVADGISGRNGSPAKEPPPSEADFGVDRPAVNGQKSAGGLLEPASNGRAGRALHPKSESGNESGNFPESNDVENRDVTDPHDQQLISECLAGRMGAFDELVLRYQDRLYNSLFRILRSAEDARDIAQEAWIHAYQGLGTFRGNSAFYSWLFRIAYNAAVSEKRKVRVSAASIDLARESSGYEPHDPRCEAEPSHGVERAERAHQVRVALDALSEEFRTVLVLKEMENMRYDEIAELVGCPIGTVRSRIHRARAELAIRLQHLVSEDSI